jgi:uncharacterized protein (DUF1501 family)
MPSLNLITRRGFLDRSLKLSLATALATLGDVPGVVKRALAEGTIGKNGKKVLFIFLRGANDGLNSVVPILDDGYAAVRPEIAIRPDPATDYRRTGPCDVPVSASPNDPTYSYNMAIRLGNGFAGLHPSLKFLAPLYNDGELALIHRVGYPKQSRSHFDSQNYWENGSPNSGAIKDGILYRTMVESGLANLAPLTGVSVQSSLPLILRGSKAAMTNLSDPTRYGLLGLPNTEAGQAKAENFMRQANAVPFATKHQRELLELQYRNLSDTLSIFSSLDFSETGNTFVDDGKTDGDTAPYRLFPTSNATNGGYALHNNSAQKYVVPTGAYGFFERLKAAALILNKTDAIVAGTEFGGFDTHSNQGGATGSHANLQRQIGWALYALRKYFSGYADRCQWKDLVVVTLSEFGRTSKENSDNGTDHAEAGVMFVAGGGIKGYNRGSASGVFGCSPNDAYNGQVLPWKTGDTGSMFGVSGRYLQRAVDYRSILGEIIRDHLGATQPQLDRIIPGYASAGEALKTGGISTKDGTKIFGELGLV